MSARRSPTGSSPMAADRPPPGPPGCDRCGPRGGRRRRPLVRRRAAGALLRRLSGGEAVSDQVDWQHVVGEIEDLGHDYAQRAAQNEVARLTARLAAAEAEVNELRARLQDLTGKLTDTQAKSATTQNRVETATARAAAAVKSEQAVRQTEAERKGKGRPARLRAAWWRNSEMPAADDLRRVLRRAAWRPGRNCPLSPHRDSSAR